VRGYHPLIATRADTGEVLHIRPFKGSANTSRGVLRFCDELIARRERRRSQAAARRLATCSNRTFERLERAARSVRLQPPVRAAIEQLDEHAWTAG
jgi:hypothetical protein